MVDHTVVAMVLARGLALGLGAVLTAIAIQAYRRTHLSFARWAAVGFGVVTAGAVVEGLLFHVGGIDLVTVHTAGSLTVGIGFALLLVSLYRE